MESLELGLRNGRRNVKAIGIIREDETAKRKKEETEKQRKE